MQLIMKVFYEDSPLGSVSKEKPWIGYSLTLQTVLSVSKWTTLHPRYDPFIGVCLKVRSKVQCVTYCIHLHWVTLFERMA